MKDILLRAAKEQSSDAYTDRLKALINEVAALKEKRVFIEYQRKENSRVRTASTTLL